MTPEQIDAQIAVLQAEKKRREDAAIDSAFDSIKHLDNDQLRKLRDRIDQHLNKPNYDKAALLEERVNQQVTQQTRQKIDRRIVEMSRRAQFSR